MKNIKGFAVANDGAMKRIAVTYDEINDKGEIINANVKINRIVTDEKTLKALETVQKFAETIVEE
jgi:hypothetical protein